jgi:hypothetical protein
MVTPRDGDTCHMVIPCDMVIPRYGDTSYPPRETLHTFKVARYQVTPRELDTQIQDTQI